MNITPAQLTKRVERWQTILAPLGVGHWAVEEVALCDETPGGYDAAASAGVSQKYDFVHFHFTFDFIANADDRKLDEVIIHEWLHVAMRDFDRAVEHAESWMPRGSDLGERIDFEREGLIDRLARLIYALHA